MIEFSQLLESHPADRKPDENKAIAESLVQLLKFRPGLLPERAEQIQLALMRIVPSLDLYWDSPDGAFKVKSNDQAWILFRRGNREFEGLVEWEVMAVMLSVVI